MVNVTILYNNMSKSFKDLWEVHKAHIVAGVNSAIVTELVNTGVLPYSQYSVMQSFITGTILDFFTSHYILGKSFDM
jgi:hypothetical protein